MTLKLGIHHWVLEYYQVCSNDAPGLTLTYFKARSNVVPYAFIGEKVKAMDFSETIVLYDRKVRRCSELNGYMKLYEYSHPVGLDVWFFVRPLVYCHTSRVRTANALAGAFAGRIYDKYYNLISWLRLTVSTVFLNLWNQHQIKQTGIIQTQYLCKYLVTDVRLGV